MPCFLGCLALIVPRFTIVLVVIFSDYLGEAYRTTLWPLLGFFFLPLTTLVYAWAIHGQDGVAGARLVAVVIAVLIDLGIVGGNAKNASDA